MSLAGLDTPAVERAFQAAQAHPDGGWLLLHYVTRDELDVLVGGTDGLPAFHDAVAAYHKQSPLYGFLHIQGKRLFLKYCPSGTSRLLQARTTVHSQLVSDRLAPHDATLNCTDPNDISKAKLFPVLGLTTTKEVDVKEKLRGQSSQDLLVAFSGKEALDFQSTNPEVMSILARIKAARTDSAPQTEARRTSFSGASGHGIIIDPYLSQLPPARSAIRSTSQRSNRRSAERGSQQSQPLASPTEFNEIDELEYMYNMLKPKEKRTAKPANIEKVQKTIAAGQIRQKLPAGMRVGRTNSGNKPVRSHGRSNSAIEEWRQRNAIPDISTTTEGADTRQSIDKQKISMESKSANEEKTGVTRQPSSAARSQRASGKPAEALATPLTLASRKSYDMLRPDGPSARPSYTSYDNRSVLTPEKQRLMKALAMRRRQLGAASRRTTADTESELLLVVEPDHGMQSTLMEANSAADQAQPATTHAKQSSVSDLPPVISPVDLGGGTDKFFSQELAKDSNDKLDSQPAPPEESKSVHDQVVREPEDTPFSEPPIASDNKISSIQDPVVTAPQDVHEEELGIKESSLFSSRHLAVESPAHAKSLSTSKRNSPRGHSRRTSHNTQAEGEFDDGLSPSESLIEELRRATVQEAKQVTATHTMSPKIVAKEGPNTIPSPLHFPTASTPLSTDEVKASPVDSILTAYPFPRALATVTEASSAESSRNATPVTAPQARDNLREQGKSRPQTRRDNTTSWLSISRTPTEDSVSEDQRHGGTSFTSHESTPLTPPPKHYSHNPRGNSRLPEIHPNSRAQSTYGQPRPQQGYDYGRSTTLTHDSSPVKRTPSLSLFTRHRDRRAQSTTDLLNDSSSPTMKSPKSARSPRSHFGRDSTSSISTVNQQKYMKSDLIHATPTPTAGRRSSETSHFSRFHSRAPSVVSLEPVDEEARQKRGSWAMRTLKRMSGLSASSRNSLTRLGEQCATENGVGSGPVSKIPEIAKNSGNLNAVNVPAVVTQLEAHLPIVMGELNCLLPDSLLWKRKWVEVVTGNYLVLSGMSVQERAKTQPNRWHLSSFRPPYAVGADREELPYSVIFELREGGKVQFACGDRDGQVQVLEYLLDAHRICFAGELLRR